MVIEELARRSRSFRRFHQDPLDEQTLVGLVRMAQLCPSAANRQPLKYLLSWEPDRNRSIFPHLRWAAALADWPGPAEDERPTGYVILLGDRRIATNFYCDHGIAAQTMLLAAAEQGLGGCMIGSIDRDGLRQSLAIAEHFDILLVVALGKPKEKVVLHLGQRPEPTPYWRDADGVHHVPKRPLDELLLRLP